MRCPKRPICEGAILTLREWVPETSQEAGSYTGREVLVRVGYVLPLTLIKRPDVVVFTVVDPQVLP